MNVSSISTVVLSVIIANYNNRELLRKCLASIYDNPPHCPFNVIVVDDASADGSYEMVQKDFPQVYAMRNSVNVHYGLSNNRALDIAKCDFVLLLNNDTIILPDALDRMVEFLRETPRAWAVGCKLLNGDGSIQASVKSLPCFLSGVFGDRSIVRKMFPNNRFTKQHLLHLAEDMSKPFKGGYVSSAAILIRNDAAKRVGGLDERLSYHVDADYCKRIWNEGGEVWYLPSAVIIHDAHKGGTMVSFKRRLKSIIEFHRGTYIYYQKHVMNSPWNPMCLVVIVGLGMRFLVSLSWQMAKEVPLIFSR